MPLEGRRGEMKGNIASFQTTCSSQGCAGAPRAGRLWVSCFLLEPWLSQPLRIFLEFPPFVIKFLVIVSRASLGQELQHWGRNCVALCLSFLRAVDTKPFVSSFGILLTHRVLLALPFLPWLSPLGAARRQRGGRWMAEPFL